MLKRLTVVMAVMVMVGLLMGGAGVSKAWAMHGKARHQKQAILMVAFGTSVPQAQKAFQIVDERVKEAFPGVEVRWAYTSGVIRKKLAARGTSIDSPEMALARLMDDGFTQVAVCSLHTIPGEEFHELYGNVRLFAQMAGGFDRVSVARPLLSSYEDMTRGVTALLDQVPADRKPADAVIFMGHGSGHHPADAVYTAMDALFQKADPNAFLATVEGHPTLQDVIPILKARKITRAYLVPLMLVAGDHARNDMAGDEPDSWKSVLKAQGIQAVPVLRGTAEISQVVDVWLDHLRQVLRAPKE
ncbi:anaerobic cobaltochelatase [Desulfacinum hydrothermale DSM 13146]|uniref:Anaerobic cobaltochelatase n=1 Tax=Desulfacinum hydrothermale DSM 13146 TaxID=1121390 RepID=A0A1W1X0W9_9BACT|nr:sirohydrochlorin cobaltochelatase [Desulfacinum hydrothermale]SMC17368.1 anaerobic cobaltochelatase [Desulfacinum hydrothermale DSM 13146]